MAFSLAHTIAQDNTSDATRAATAIDMYEYFFDTFLPARGCTTTVKNSTSRGVIWNVTDLRTNTNWPMYNWFSWGTSGTYTLTQYEDATYTSTPGDLMTDTTNSLVTTSVTGNALYATSDYKFWTSSEDSTLYIVTQGYKLHFFGCKPKIWVRESHSGYPAANNVDRYSTHMFLPAYNCFHMSNLPAYSNTNTAEGAISTTQPSQYEYSTNPIFIRDFVLMQGSDIMGSIDYSDFRYYSGAESVRTTSSQSEQLSSLSIQDLYKYNVNTTDWWIVSGINTDADGGLAFYCGTTEPDIS